MATYTYDPELCRLEHVDTILERYAKDCMDNSADYDSNDDRSDTAGVYDKTVIEKLIGRISRRRRSWFPSQQPITP